MQAAAAVTESPAPRRTPEDFVRDAQAAADAAGQGKKFRAAYDRFRFNNGLRGAGLLALREVDVEIPEGWRPLT